MAHWGPVDRHTTLPPNWSQLRALVLDRDNHQCQWALGHGSICGAPANQCDHVGDSNNHHPSNLRALCTPHHAQRTAAQGGRAKAARYSTARPARRHPGLK